jgi:[protein-PII] uridylyltransferase
LALVDRGFLHEEHVRETFLEILNQRGNVASVLRSMHEVGLLGKYIPEFGKLTCLVQHEFFHVYAADEHTLMCLEQLDRIWGAEQEPLGKYRELFQDLEQPFVLYLALLLHDAGKANHTGQHALAGGQLALRVAKRLRLDGVATHALRLVIEHHLAMAMVAQRRDIEDPAVIHHFATQMQTPPNLRMLTLLTVADAYATSAELWNGFKDSLHWRLYQKTLQALAGGTAFIRAEEKQKELLAEEVWELSSRLISREEIEAHFSTLPPRYYQMHSAREIVADLTLAHHFLQKQVVADLHGLEPVTDWHNEPDRGHTTVKVCTWDRAGLFSKIAGSFSASGINILSALVFTRTDGIVLDTFYVTEARTGDLVPKPQRDAFDEILLQALTEGVDLRPLIARQRLPRPLYQPLAWVQIPTRIHFDDTVSETRTVLEVETEDRVGLLYAISQVLSECRLDISLAKISTEKGAAIDTFYICEADGQKVASPERQRFIDEQLRAAIAALDQ